METLARGVDVLPTILEVLDLAPYLADRSPATPPASPGGSDTAAAAAASASATPPPGGAMRGRYVYDLISVVRHQGKSIYEEQPNGTYRWSVKKSFRLDYFADDLDHVLAQMKNN